MPNLTDKLVGAGVKPELSPNPARSGYTKQFIVDGNEQRLGDISPAEVNTLYICQNGHKYVYLGDNIAYQPDTAYGFKRVFDDPALDYENKGQETPRKEVTAPQKRPQTFPDPVAFQDEVYIRGKKLEDYIDSQGGVTEAELQAALQTKQDKLVGSGEGQNLKQVGGQSLLGTGNIDVGTAVVANPSSNSGAEITGIQIGSTKYKVAESVGYLTTAPSAANTSGRLIFVVLTSEPATKYDGYFYIITEA